MNNDELKSAFDSQAAGYDKQWAKLAPIRESLHFLLESVFAELPADANVLCVGVGTGAELAHLARRFSQWRFTAVEPSGAMLDRCRERARQDGLESRCRFHEGYVESLPAGEPHHAATSFLVSQFIVDPPTRVAYFRSIAARLHPGGILASADLASDTRSLEYEALVKTWMNMMAGAGVPPEALARMREAWKKDVAILPPADIARIIASGGFESPTLFHQAALIHAWFARRAA
jgi:tRNA (cmo5U34)-methyltransferase